MAGVMVEKSADDLRREIDELHRQQREITERLRDPRGLRKGANVGVGIRGGGHPRLLGRGGSARGTIRRGDPVDTEEQPPIKKRLLSAVVKVDEADGDEEDKNETVEPKPENDEVRPDEHIGERRPFLQRTYGTGRREFRGGNRVSLEQDNETAEPLPRVMPKIDDPNVAKRNRRMFGALLGTLEKFRQEDKKLAGSEAFLRRSTSQKRAEQRALEESERLRQQEREQLAEKRRRDLILRARLAAKAEEKQLEVLFIQWTEHQSKLCSFLRTKAEPSIFYMPAKPSTETDNLLETGKEILVEWRNRRRLELTEYQKQRTADHLARVEMEIDSSQANSQPGNSNDAQIITAETEPADVTGDIDRVPGKHGWNRNRALQVSDIGEDQEEDIAEDEVKTDTESEAKTGSLEVETKEIDGENLDIKEENDHGALKDVLGYASGEGEMEER